MERLILKELLNWKNSHYRKSLILKGVCQVGKTWILKEFGKRATVPLPYISQPKKEGPFKSLPHKKAKKTPRKINSSEP